MAMSDLTISRFSPFSETLRQVSCLEYASAHSTFPSCSHAVESMERDRFMSPHQACNFGLIDEVIEHRPALAEIESSTKP